MENKKWTDLIAAYGGQTPFSEILGCSQSHVSKLASGVTTPSLDERRKIVRLAVAKRLPSPVAPQSDNNGELDRVDRRILTLLGRTLRDKKSVHPEFSKRLAKTIGERTLIQLAESDEAEPILIAATHLLEASTGGQ